MEMINRAQFKMLSRVCGLFIVICLFQEGNALQTSTGFDRLSNKLEELCFANPRNYINDYRKCKISFYEGICWPETSAGKTSEQRCSYVMHNGKGIARRKCGVSSTWEKVDLSNCSIVPNPGGSNTISTATNCSTMAVTSALTAKDRLNQKKLYEVMTWIAIIIMLPSLVVLFIVRKERIDYFLIHMNLILALLLQCLTYFIDYYGALSEDTNKQTFCNFIWVLNQLFVAATVMWVLIESLYLLYMLRSSYFEKTSYFWYYVILGWGFPFFLVMCVYMTTIQFTVGTIDIRCWSHYRQSPYGLVVYIPLTLVLIVNMGILSYMVYVTKQKKRSNLNTGLETNTIKENVRKALLWMPLLSIIYLLKFYVSESNVGFGYLLSFFYPLQGVPICLVYVVFDRDARNGVKNRWYLWKYGKLPETSSTDGKRQYRFSDDERFLNSPFCMHEGHAMKTCAKDGRHSAKVAPTPNSRPGSQNDVMYLYRGNSSNKIDSVKAAWDQTSKQNSALDEDQADSLPNKPELVDGDTEKQKSTLGTSGKVEDSFSNSFLDEAGKEGEENKDGEGKDVTDGVKKEEEQKVNAVKAKPRINYQAKWRGAGRAVLMSKRGFKGPPGYHMSLTAQQARAKWIVELWSGQGGQPKDILA